MAVIKNRSRLSKKTFAVPPKGGEPGKYPMPDMAHARNAAARASAHGTPTEKKQVARAIQRKYPALAKRSEFVKKYK